MTGVDSDVSIRGDVTDSGFGSAHELAGMIQRRDVSSEEIVTLYLSRIKQHNPSIQAIVTLDEDGARERARAADAALSRGEVWGPLHGVPFTLEDCHATAGLRSTWGGVPRLAEYVPTQDGTVAARLKGAGGVLLGKTNGPTIWPDSMFARTNNPWNLTRTPGASSAGPAAALAAGLTPLDIGLDTLASIQNPAHYCGVYGMRPTEHRVPLTGAFFLDPVRKFRVMSTVGPMARSVEDLRLALSLLSGSDGVDPEVPPSAWRAPAPLDLATIRVACSPTIRGDKVKEEIGAAVAHVEKELAARGAVVDEALPNADLEEQLQLGFEIFGLVASTFSDDGAQRSLEAYLAALDHRDRIMGAWDRFFQEWDVLVAPAGAQVAPEHDAEARDESLYLYALSCVSGCPMIVLPAGVDRRGLPFGVQLLSRRWRDERLLDIAQVVSRLTPGFQRPPGF